MKQFILLITGLWLYSILFQPAILGCTIFKVTRDGVTLVGNNEDGTDATTYLWFIPASKGKYGRVYFTLSDKWPQGGMNDQGLFYDGTSAPWKAVVKSLDKPEYRGNLSGKILESCATVPEALSLLQQYNLGYFRNGQMFLADKLGHSAIVEGDTIILGTDYYQIATNFYTSNPSLGGYPCHRYDIAETMIKNLPILSVDVFRTILEAVHLEGYSFTQYSTIYDLAQTTFYYYKDSNFKEAVKIDLKKELQKKKRWYETKEFFREKEKINDKTGNTKYFQENIISHFPNKAVKCSLHFSNDLLHGPSEGFYDNGQRSWNATFDRGKRIGALHNWNQSGAPILGYRFIDRNHTDLLDYFPGGALMLKLSFTKVGGDSIEPFRVLVYNEDGRLNYQGTYKNGLFFLDNKNRPYSGGISVYYKNGNPFTQAEYKAGKPDGTLKQWDAKGNLVKTEVYQNGILTGIRRY